MKYRIKLRIIAPDSDGVPRKVAFELEEGQRFYLGTKTEGIDFRHSSVLPEHCFLVVRGGALTVSDISGGRAMVNGEKIISSVVRAEDRLEMGEFKLEFLEVPVPPPAPHLETTRPIDPSELEAGPEYEYELQTLSEMRPRAPAEDEPSITRSTPEPPSLSDLPRDLHEPSARVQVAEVPRPRVLAHGMDAPVELDTVAHVVQKPARRRRRTDPGHGAPTGLISRAVGRLFGTVRFVASTIFFLLQLGLVAGSITGGYWFIQEYSKAGTIGVAIDEVRARVNAMIPHGLPRAPAGEPSRAPASRPEQAARAQDRFLATQLLEAARKGNLIAMRNLVNDARINIDYRSPEGMTPLMAAAEAGQLEMARLLVTTGANPNAADANGTTPLMWAVFRDHKSVIAFLVSHGARVLASRPNGETALQIAQRWGHAETVRFLKNPEAHPRYGVPGESSRATASEPSAKRPSKSPGAGSAGGSARSSKKSASKKRGPSSSHGAPASDGRKAKAQVRPSFIAGQPEKKSRGGEKHEQKLDLTRHD